MAFIATLLFELGLLFPLEPLLTFVEPDFLLELLLGAMTLKTKCGTSKLIILKEKSASSFSGWLLGSVIDNQGGVDEPFRQKTFARDHLADASS